MPETINVTFTSDSSKFQLEASKVIDTIGKVETATKRARSVGLPMAEITPASLKAMDRAAVLHGELARRTQLAGQAGKNGSLGFLAFSQAVEDAQYGVKGVLNNIPQMVLGFGGGAGLAGVLSLAAVAAYGAWQAFQKFSGISAMEKWAKDSAKATNAFTDAIRRNKAETIALQALTASENVINASRSNEESRISRGVGFDESYYLGREQEKARIERQRASMSALISAGVPGVTGEDPSQQGNREWENALRKYNLDQLQATEKIAAAQETLNKLSQDYSRITANSGDLFTRYQKQKNAALVEEEEMRKKLASLEAEKARAQEEVTAPENTSLRRQQELIVVRIQEEIDLRKAGYKIKQDEVALADDLLKKTKEEADANRKILADKKAGLVVEIETGKEELRRRKLIAERESKEIQLRALQAQTPALQEAADTARQQQQAVTPDLQDLILSRARRDGKITPQAGRDAAQAVKDSREAESRAKENGMSVEENRRIVEEMRKNEEFLAKNTGTIKERREQRTADRQAARDEKRNERVRSAARERESRDQNGRQIPDDRIDPGAKAREADQRVENAQKDVEDNLTEQLDIQRKIQESVDKLAQNLGTL